MPSWQKADVQAIRGAITVQDNTAEAIDEATCDMLRTIQRKNGIGPESVVSAFFSLTPDLNATFPARAARGIGWGSVPMLDTVELDVPGSLRRTIRVLVHVDREGPVHHAYLRGAEILRPDLVEKE
jgi:chorismate mutase